MSSVKPVPSSRRKSKGRTFQCTGYPDCNMTFTRSEHLARHIRKHTGERPFECVHCARKFSRLDNLRQHKQTVHAHEQLFISYGKPLPALPQEAQEQNKENQLKKQDEVIVQARQPSQPSEPSELSEPSEPSQPSQPNQSSQSSQSSQLELPASSQNLLKPTQFRSKHRPRPLDLPRGPVYHDAPYTTPTPRSSDSQRFVLSPVSPGHQAQQTITANLPSFQFLTAQSIRDSAYSNQPLRDSTLSNRASVGDSTYSNYSSLRDSTYSNHSINSNHSNHDSLVSPYNSSFTSYSTSTTPLNSSFETGIKTPTNSQFSVSSNCANPHHGPGAISSFQTTGSRKSWLNNVLNSTNSNVVNHSPESTPENQHSPASHGNRLRIESLLNTGKKDEYETNKRLPPVDNLGIETVNRI